MNREIRKLYLRFRQTGMNAAHALHSAHILQRFNLLEDAGFVRIDVQPDDSPDLSWLEQDHYSADRQGRALRKQTLDSIERDGVWGTVGEYRLDPESDRWQHADSCWGHIGYRDVSSPFENWYVIDHMGACIDALKTALRKRFCPSCGHRTAA